MKNLDNISNFRRIDLYGDGFLGDEANGAFIIDRYNNGEFYQMAKDGIMLVLLFIKKMVVRLKSVHHIKK